jgi:multiple sugar transport system substrate-binding protein/sn-glycerol 3-phosphate transport system substrate-binding protein
MKKTARTILPGILLGFLFLNGVQGYGQNLSNLDPKGTTITYWYQHSQAREAALQTLIAQFNKENPWGITVKGEYAGNYADIFNKMSAAIAGGVGPDLVVAYQNDAASYWQADAIVDLNPYVNDPKYGISPQDQKDFFADFLAQDVQARFGGKRLGWPPNRSLEVLYYNADWLKAIGFSSPPKNWQEFADACRKATDPAKGTVGYEIKTDASCVFAQVIGRGGDFLTPDGQGYSLDTPETRAALAYLQQLYKKGYAHKIAEKFGDQADFANQKVLFTMDSTAGLSFYAKAIQGNPHGAFSWGVAAVPHETPGPVLDIYGSSVSVVKSTPQKQLSAWLFLRWMSEPKQQAAWVRASDYFPVRQSVASELGDFLKINRPFAQAFDLLKASRQKGEPTFPGYEQVRDAVTASLNAVLDGAEIEPTLVELQKKAVKSLRQ